MLKNLFISKNLKWYGKEVKRMKRFYMFLITLLIAVSAFFLFIGEASATAFDSGIPAGWTCVGNCGTLGADGVVTTSPEGGDYGWVMYKVTLLPDAKDSFKKLDNPVQYRIVEKIDWLAKNSELII